MNVRNRHRGTAARAIGGLLGLLAAASGASADEPASFRRDVAPILARKCLGCHNDAKADAGLDLSTFVRLKAGGKGMGALILEPGDPDASHLVEVVRPDAEPRMPYKLPPLSDEEIATLERWVRQGAAFDGPSEAETTLASLVDPLAGLPEIAPAVPTSDPAAAAAFSPDGKMLAVAVGPVVELFRVPDREPVARLSGAPGPVAALRFTPDGRRLVAAGGRPGMFGAVTVWAVEDGSVVHDLRGHADAILAADLSPDGKTLATASYDRLALLWDLESGRVARTLKEHTDAVYAVAFAPDGRTLATAAGDRTIKLWDAASGARIATLSDPIAEQYALAFGPGGSSLLAAGVDRMIRAWDLRAPGRPLLGSAFAHDAPVLRLAVAPDGRTLYSAGEDRALKAWDLDGLRPRAALPSQPDWPLALAVAPDGSRLAVGRYDGSVALLDPTGSAVPIELRSAPSATAAAPAPAEKPGPVDLVRAPALNPPSPRGTARATTRRVVLSGPEVGRAEEVQLPEPGIVAAVVPAETPDPNRLEVDLAIAPDARPGVHRIGVRTPLGVAPLQPFAVSAHPEHPLGEPDDPRPVATPATLVGAIDRPGDVDEATLELEAGRAFVAEAIAREIGSALSPWLEMLDSSGRVVATSAVAEGSGEGPILVFTPPVGGTFRLRISDAQSGGSGNHLYRVAVGALPRVAAAFPLGVARGESASIAVEGVNLGDASAATVSGEAQPGSIVSVPLPGLGLPLAGRAPSVVVAEGPQGVESEPNDDPGRADTVAVPGGISGRIDRDGDVDHARFAARAGETLVVEVFARRLGMPVDPAVEILDAGGNPVPRAVLRPTALTEVAFRDHDSGNPKIRLTRWDDLAVDDFLLVGRDLMKILALPRNPDDDCTFYASRGKRLGFLEATPEQHPQGRPMYRVEVHPPGTAFPPGGTPPVTLTYRNDDGGPALGKDALVTFIAPADGEYLARVEDARGLGGPGHGYHLVVRRPRPDFRPAVSVEDPNVPRDGSTVVTVSVDRLDGFGGAVVVAVEGLPPGISATSARIEPGQASADLVLSAEPDAPAGSPPTWKVVARSGDLAREVDPGGPAGGRVSVTPRAELAVSADRDRLEIAPGETAELTFRVDRRGGFEGRVPIEVRNLPHGVRVLDVGLNGVLVTEKESARSVRLYAEPWVGPAERPIYAEARLELLGEAKGGLTRPVIGSSRPAASGPIALVVRPRKGAPAD